MGSKTTRTATSESSDAKDIRTLLAENVIEQDPKKLPEMHVSRNRNGCEDSSGRTKWVVGFGTLLFRPVIEGLLERDVFIQSASLHGYSRHPIIRKNKSGVGAGPAIITCPSSTVECVVFQLLHPWEWCVIDAFEKAAEGYACSRLFPTADDGSSVEAYGYIADLSIVRLKLDVDWDPWDFYRRKRKGHKTYTEKRIPNLLDLFWQDQERFRKAEKRRKRRKEK